MSNIISQHWTSDQEKLEAFVLNKFNKKEMSLLAVHLEKCDECNKRVQEERELRAGIRRFGRMEMKRRLKLRLRRDQGRRFEWTYVASLAAAVVVMLGAVFAIRWFIDFRQEKEKVREIMLTENKESKPAERALWIIGSVVEIKNELGGEAVSVEEKQSRNFADNLNETTEPTRQYKSKAGEESQSKIEASPLKEHEVTVLAERRPVMKDVTSSIAKTETSMAKRSDSESHAAAPAETKAMTNAPVRPEAGDNYSSGSIRGGRMNEQEIVIPRDTLISGGKGKTAPDMQLKLGFADTGGTGVKGLTSQMVEKKPELRDITSSVPSSVSIADNKFDYRDRSISKKKASPIVRKRRPAKNIFVRRGDMKDLPPSMIKYAPSAVHTRLEKTPKGILLTFYSYEIKDTTATYIEAVTQDSIIVFFHSKQIAYHIPGGLAKGM